MTKLGETIGKLREKPLPFRTIEELRQSRAYRLASKTGRKKMEEQYKNRKLGDF